MLILFSLLFRPFSHRWELAGGLLLPAYIRRPARLWRCCRPLAFSFSLVTAAEYISSQL
jgi:hypothetical protein